MCIKSILFLRVLFTGQVEQYAVKKMVDTACLDKLLSIVTGLGAVEVADEFGDRPLDGEYRQIIIIITLLSNS